MDTELAESMCQCDPDVCVISFHLTCGDEHSDL